MPVLPQNKLTSHRRIIVLAMTGPGQGSLLSKAHRQGLDSIGPVKRIPIKRETKRLTNRETERACLRMFFHALATRRRIDLDAIPLG